MDLTMTFDPFQKNKHGKGAEKVISAKTENDPLIEQTKKIYRTHRDLRAVDETKDLAHKVPILSPVQISIINEYANDIEPLFRNRMYADRLASLFLTALMQKSYDAGNNDFEIQTGNQAYSHLGSGLKGTKKNRLRFSVIGQLDWYFALNASYVEASVIGNSNTQFGSHAKGSSFSINGDPGSLCLYSARKCTMTLEGLTKEFNWGGPFSSAFYAKDESTYKNLRRNIPFFIRAVYLNRVVLQK